MPIEQTMQPQFGVASLATVYASTPGAATDILTTAVKVGPSASAMRVSVCLTSSSVFNYTVTDGTTPYTISLNGGVALSAGCEYSFVVGARRYKSQPYTDGTTAQLSYNFQVASNVVVRKLFVDEIIGAAV